MLALICRFGNVSHIQALKPTLSLTPSSLPLSLSLSLFLSLSHSLFTLTMLHEGRHLQSHHFPPSHSVPLPSPPPPPQTASGPVDQSHSPMLHGRLPHLWQHLIGSAGWWARLVVAAGVGDVAEHMHIHLNTET